MTEQAHDSGTPVAPDLTNHPLDQVETAWPTMHQLPSAVRVDENSPQLTTSPTIGKLAGALARAQGKIKQPSKKADNPFFKSKYADLHEVWSAARAALSEEGVAVIQTPAFIVSEIKGKTVGIITISTTVIHAESGEWMTNVLRGTSDNIGPQAIGSAISYFRRYSLQPMLMLTPDDGSDDDAEKAEGRKTTPDEDKPTADDIAKHTKAIKEATTLAALEAAYKAIPEAHRKPFNKLAGVRKEVLERAAQTPQITDPDAEAQQPSGNPDQGGGA